MLDDNKSFSFFTDYDGVGEVKIDTPMPKRLPILFLRNIVAMPGVVLPIAVGRASSLAVVKRAHEKSSYILAVSQKQPEVEYPSFGDFYELGVVCKVLKVLELPDGNTTVILHGLVTATLKDPDHCGDHMEAQPIVRQENTNEIEHKSYEVMLDAIQERVRTFGQMTELPNELIQGIMSNIPNPYFLNIVTANLPLSVDKKMDILSSISPLQRGQLLLGFLNMEIEYARLRREITMQTQADIDKQQREYFLQQEIRNIQAQLGQSSSDDISELKKAAAKINMGEEGNKVFERELNKMERIPQQSPDYNILLNYLQTLLQLPWDKSTKDNLDLNNAQRVLDRNHYGMEEVKERILEHLAVRKMCGAAHKPTILCLFGPPGVGKTSLCRSIAKALKRKYVRASLGGLHDEAEIRGHRRTYIGAMPGRIIKCLIKAGSNNPVFVLDEIDKVTQTAVHGDPASALLEVLDPEQNQTFHDNFLDLDYDLSKVMFIATANNVGTIPRPLLDRMELIEVSSYITEEKVEIAKRHLVPRVKEDCGIGNERGIKLNQAALEFLIENYTRESGVRGLEKELNSFFRKMVLYHERNLTFPTMTIKPKDIEQLLGKPKFTRDSYQGNGFAGVVTGLAWTSVGGEILFIETSLSKGRGQKLTITGNLGDVMKESAILALEFIKAHADTLGIDIRIFDNYNIHLHVPEGAVPKDGPSAGITMATSMVSALTQRKVRKNLAMTGEITLRGKVLPVGGIKEKILAAKRAGIKHIILCENNRKDIEEINERYLTDLDFHYVKTIMDVLDFALLEQQVEQPLQFTFEENKEQEITQ